MARTVAKPTTLVWYRQDLRVDDHPALAAAARRGAVAPVYVWSPREEGDWPPGAAAGVWIDAALRDLDESLRGRGSRLTLRIAADGGAAAELLAAARCVGADQVHAMRRYEPAAIEQEKRVATALQTAGVELRLFSGALLFEPDEVNTRSGGPFQVFTPFHRYCMQWPQPPAPVDAPAGLEAPSRWPASTAADDLALRPSVPWDESIRAAWVMTQQAAHDRLEAFLDAPIEDYAGNRDRPDLDAVSRLSPYLHHGQISVRRVWHALCRDRRGRRTGQLAKGPEAWRRQLLWREFAHHLLVHFPWMPAHPLREKYAAFPWREDGEHLRAWQRGRAGYPLIDAAMRQLWSTGWMHNRARMVVGSFLVKDLLLSWRHGAAWFWDTLVDADLANNTFGWQWVAGCGADAAPYFRIFNPTAQARRFDPHGAYIRRWLPEIAHLDNKRLLDMPTAGHADVGAYPRPMVDHLEARIRALDALSRITRQ